MNLGSMDVLTEVEQLEREYRWEEAAKQLQVAAKTATEAGGFRQASEIHERIGACFERAAFQAENVEAFDRLLESSIRSFRTASDLRLGSQAPEKEARAKFLEARALFLEADLLSQDIDVKAKLESALALTKEALEHYDKHNRYEAVGQICNFLVRCLSNRLDFSSTGEEIRHLSLDLLTYGDRAVSIFSELKDEERLLEAYVRQIYPLIDWAHPILPDKSQREDCWKKITRYASEAVKLTDSVRDDYWKAYALFEEAHVAEHEEKRDEAIQPVVKKGFQHAEVCRDNFMLAALSWFSVTFYGNRLASEENPDRATELYKEGIRTVEQALRYADRFRGVKRDLVWALFNLSLGGLHRRFAKYVETDIEAQKRILNAAIDVISKTLEVASRRAWRYWGWGSSLSLSKSLLAILETDESVRRRLLREAIELQEEYVELLKDIHTEGHPFYALTRASVIRTLATGLFELTQVEPDKQKKIQILRQAASNMDECFVFTMSAGDFADRPLWLAESYALYAKILQFLHELVGDEQLLRQTVQNLQLSASSYEQAGLPSRAAEAQWRIADAFSRSRQHMEAANSFATASKAYSLASEKVPQLADFYRDHSNYMRAWSEIERARHVHSQENFQEAAQYYEKASEILKETKNWSHLSGHYVACALVEKGEASSREENPEDAYTRFSDAAQLFENYSMQLKSKMIEAKNSSEQGVLSEWISINEGRRTYCLARALLEEGRLLDRKGDRALSAQKYSQAAKAFDVLTERVPEDRAELESLALLSRALETMENAEKLASPELFSQSAELFEKAGRASGRDRIRMMTEANAYFCRALEAATIFKTAKNMEMYSKSKVLMENAAELYMRAGFEETSGWIKATHRMIDAYAYLLNAETEFDHKKKSEHYGIAERLLDSSAQLFEESGFIKKKEETLHYLRRVREQRELFTFPTEQSVAISTSLNVTSPPLSHDRPLGVEMFETANIQANLLTRDREVKVGDRIHLELELVNVGRGPALLVKMEDIAPEGLELLEVPAPYRNEDGYLSMKGKRLDPLKTEEVKLVLKPKVKGEFSIKPRILYLDEKGKYRYHEPEPISVVVKELGIKGWIKGPGS